jgi:hypothetical protein
LRTAPAVATISERSTQPIRAALARNERLVATLSPVLTGPTVVVRNVLGLGSGDVTLAGGILDIGNNSSTPTPASGAQNEVIDAINVIQVGPGSGQNLVVPALNNFGQANTTSTVTMSETGVGYTKINNVTLNAPNFTWTTGSGANVMIAGTLDLSGNANNDVKLNVVSASQGAAISGQIVGHTGVNDSITKIGAGPLLITNGRTSLRNDGTVDPAGQGANQVAAWNVAAGTLEVRTAGGGLNPLGGTNTVGDNAALNLLGATVNIRHDGDGTTVMQRLDTFLHNNVTVGSTASLLWSQDSIVVSTFPKP